MLYTNRRVYRRDENVRMIFSKTNVQATPMTLEYRTGQQFDILITRAGEEVWRWSHGKVFVLVVTQTTLAPGESQVFRELWTQVDNQGQPVPTGRYVVTAWNTSTNVEVTVDIEITE
ncbi:MAG TPA: hypothetical protein GX506_11335 [Firmicutes bacterium]|nr:hypothetical protein [Bacillota bacterium]